ncbi:MAG: hypothetical protein M3487_07815, partial [Actinomycetota bacterium]|nr:hypothetical protein [Actinomycetota bacterium]
RRGFDQQEVRDFLRMVAAELARLQERERFLERELRAAQGTGTATNPVIDEDTATRLLGEEAARILQTAREGSAQIKAKAEEGAARLLRESTEEANRLREQAEIEGSRRRRDAASDAEAELAMAKQQGREMVEEARSYRERVLGELARRRELARQQIDQLIHGRDRLLQAFERARLVAVDVVAELAPLSEPDEYVDLTPTTGPVPLTVPAARLGDASAIGSTRLPGELADDEPTEHPYDGAGDEMPDDPSAPADVTAESLDQSSDPADPADPAGPTAEADEPGADVVDYPALAAVPEPETDQVAIADESVLATPTPVIDTTSAAEQAAGDHDEIDDDEVTASDVDDLFARLRAQGPPIAADEVEEESAEDADPAVPVAVDDVTPLGGVGAARGDDSAADADCDADADGAPVAETRFNVRDAALVPLIVASARKLKRVLADEQNEVLDALRRKEPVRHIDVLLPWESEQSGRYGEAISRELAAVAQAAAATMPGEVALDVGPTGVLAPARQALADGLVVPLRERLSRCVEDGDGDNDVIVKRVRAVYREWKTQRIDEQLDDILRSAYARAAYEAVEPGTSVAWTVDPDGPASPDCEDNSLAGPLIVGDAFPTGHSCPPAHPGCRCLLATVEG